MYETYKEAQTGANNKHRSTHTDILHLVIGIKYCLFNTVMSAVINSEYVSLSRSKGPPVFAYSLALN